MANLYIYICLTWLCHASEQSENLLSVFNKSYEYDFHLQPRPFWTVQFCVSASFLFIVCCSFFLEKNMLSFFLRYLQQRCGRYICVQLLQTLNILFENIRNETSLCEKPLIFVAAVGKRQNTQILTKKTFFCMGQYKSASDPQHPLKHPQQNVSLWETFIFVAAVEWPKGKTHKSWQRKLFLHGTVQKCFRPSTSSLKTSTMKCLSVRNLYICHCCRMTKRQNTQMRTKKTFFMGQYKSASDPQHPL